jgi:hypothetical protein
LTWELSKLPDNPETLTSINAETGVLYVDVMTLQPVYDSIEIKLSLNTFDINGNPSILSATKTVELYDREIQIGDYMLADGSYCAPNQYDGIKTIVAKCFYKAPVDADGKPIYPGDGSADPD